MSDTPKGVTVVILSEDGHVMGAGSDFHYSIYGGFTHAEAQRHRAKECARANMVKNCCNGTVADAIISSGLTLNSICERLYVNPGWKEHVIYHGHDDGEIPE